MRYQKMHAGRGQEIILTKNVDMDVVILTIGY